MCAMTEISHTERIQDGLSALVNAPVSLMRLDASGKCEKCQANLILSKGRVLLVALPMPFEGELFTRIGKLAKKMKTSLEIETVVLLQEEASKLLKPFSFSILCDPENAIGETFDLIEGESYHIFICEGTVHYAEPWTDNPKSKDLISKISGVFPQSDKSCKFQ